MPKSTLRIVWKTGTPWQKLRTQPALLAELNARAEAIARAAGPGYETRPAAATGGRVRGRAAVITGTPAAVRDNAKNHTLMRALGAGRK